MKPPKFLSTIINIAFFLLTVRFLISAILFILVLLGARTKLLTFTITENTIITESYFGTILFFFVQLVSAGLFLYSVFVIKKLIRSFNQKKLYSKMQISGLALTGKLIILVTLVNSLIKFISGLIEKERFQVGLAMENGYGSFWMLIAIGIFFIFLSKVFENSAWLKNENELTI